MRAKNIEELPGTGRMIATFECSYCRKDKVIEVSRSERTNAVINSQLTCDHCGMTITGDDFVEFETL